MRKSETFTALNGLRLLAALAVVIFHYAPRVESYSPVPEFLKNVIDEGPCAVAFFFILSGFVLAHRHLQPGSRAQSPADFYWARFVRLYPAYLLAFLLFTPIAMQRYLLHPSPLAGHHIFALSGILSALMLQSWTPLAQLWNGPAWSLSVEAFMYFLFPIIGYRLVRLTTRQGISVSFLAWLLPSGLALAYMEHWIPDRTWHLYLTNNPLLWIPLFMLGICASRLIPPWKKLAPGRAAMLSTLSFVLLILAALAWPHKWSDVFVTGGIAPLLAFAILCFTRSEGCIARTLGSPLFNKLGEASYAIYILQAPLWHCWQPLANLVRRAPLQTNIVPPWQFLFFGSFLIVASLAVQRFVEAPVRAVLIAWRKKSSPRVFFEGRPEPSSPLPFAGLPPLAIRPDSYRIDRMHQ